MCLPVNVFLSLSLPVSGSFIYLCLSVSDSPYLWLCYLCLCLSASASVISLCISLCLCLSLSLAPSLYASLCLSLSLYVSGSLSFCLSACFSLSLIPSVSDSLSLPVSLLFLVSLCLLPLLSAPPSLPSLGLPQLPPHPALPKKGRASARPQPPPLLEHLPPSPNPRNGTLSVMLSPPAHLSQDPWAFPGLPPPTHWMLPGRSPSGPYKQKLGVSRWRNSPCKKGRVWGEERRRWSGERGGCPEGQPERGVVGGEGRLV